MRSSPFALWVASPRRFRTLQLDALHTGAAALAWVLVQRAGSSYSGQQPFGLSLPRKTGLHFAGLFSATTERSVPPLPGPKSVQRFHGRFEVVHFRRSGARHAYPYRLTQDAQQGATRSRKSPIGFCAIAGSRFWSKRSAPFYASPVLETPLALGV